MAARWRIVPPSPPTSSGHPWRDQPSSDNRSMRRDMAATRASYGCTGRVTSSMTAGFASSQASNAVAYALRPASWPSAPVDGIDNIDVNIENWRGDAQRAVRARETEDDMADGVTTRGPSSELLVEGRRPRPTAHPNT